MPALQAGIASSFDDALTAVLVDKVDQLSSEITTPIMLEIAWRQRTAHTRLPVCHLLQIVWASTTAVGCARVDGCAAGAGLGAGWVQALYVCRYSPPGNVQSTDEYMANVHPLAALQADSSG
jgi:hypothetical protein